MVPTSPLEVSGFHHQICMFGIRTNGSHFASAPYTWMYVAAAIWRRGATQDVSLVEPTANIPGRRAFGVSTPGSERALANRYMLGQPVVSSGTPERSCKV